MKILKKLRGFSLVELIVVIVILAVISALAFMMVSKWIGKSSNARTATDISAINRVLNAFYLEKGFYPDSSNGIPISDTTGTVLGLQGIFDEIVVSSLGTLKKVPKDPIANDYYVYTKIINPSIGFEIGGVFENPELSLLGGSVYAIGSDSNIPYILSNFQGEYYDSNGNPIFPKPLSLFNSQTGKYLKQEELGISGTIIINLEQLTGVSIDTFNADGIMIGGEYGDYIKPVLGYNVSGGNILFDSGFLVQGLPIGFLPISSSSSSVSLPVDGICGSSDGQIFFDITPSNNLCNTGTSSLVVSVSTGYVRNCIGLNGGSNISCSASNSLNKWSTKTSMPTSRRNTGVGGVVGDKIYALGGRNSSSFLTIVEEYDVSNDTWTAKANMLSARNAIGVGVVGGKIYTFGGRTLTSGYFSTTDEYNPATNTWTTKSSMSSARGYVGVGVVNDKLYIIGGENSGALIKVEEYNPATNTWVTKANMPTARYFPGVGVVNNKIYVIGGSNSSNAVLNKVEEYDPATNTWVTKANMPTARRGMGVGVVNNKIYVFGGGDSSSSFNVVEEYDPATNVWTTKMAMPVSRGRFTAGVVNNKIYAIGGFDGSNGMSLVQEFAR